MDEEDRAAIVLRRRGFLARSLASLGAAATASVGGCQPCLSLAPKACPTPDGTVDLGRWLYVGGARPLIVSTVPILFVGDKEEGSVDTQEDMPAWKRMARVRLSHDNRAANEELTEDTQAMLVEGAKLLARFDTATLRVEITPEQEHPKGTNPVQSSIPVGAVRATVIGTFLGNHGRSVGAVGDGACEQGVFRQTVMFVVCGPVPTAAAP